MSVRLQRAEELCRTARANGELDLFCVLWENSSEAEIEIYLTLQEANLMWDGSAGSQIPHFIFVLVHLKIINSRLYIRSQSHKCYVKSAKTASLKCV